MFADEDNLQAHPDVPMVLTGRALLLFAAIAALVLLASIGQDLSLYGAPAPDLSSKIWVLDVDVESSVFTWLSILLAFQIGLSLWQLSIWARSQRSRFRHHWLMLSGLFFLVSLDEFLGLHEKISGRLSSFLDQGGIFHFAWALPAAILSLLGFLAFVPFLRSLPRRVGGTMSLAALVFVGGAAGVEMLTGFFMTDEGVLSLRYRLLTNLEESLEMAGLLLFSMALLFFSNHRLGGWFRT